MTTTTTDRALSVRCPFCHADPGQPCRKHRGRGAVAEWPHSRRISLANPLPAAPPIRALCCECGNLRTCKEPRNQRGYWGRADWQRELGDLKCSECGRVTTHALLKRADYAHRDHEEDMQRVALGGEVPPGWHWDAARLRSQYRQGALPRNPKLHHRYWVEDAQRAWDAGNRTVIALCGDTMTLESDPHRWDDTADRTPRYELVGPGAIDWETEFEDPETGMWWVDMDCVNCLRISNDIRRQDRRQALEMLLAWFAAHPEEIPDADGDQLIEILGRLAEPHRH